MPSVTTRQTYRDFSVESLQPDMMPSLMCVDVTLQVEDYSNAIKDVTQSDQFHILCYSLHR